MTFDGGESVLICAGRVAKKWRGGGLYGRFNTRLFQLLKGSQVSLRYVVMTVSNVVMNHEKLGPSLMSKYRLTMQRVSGIHNYWDH